MPAPLLSASDLYFLVLVGLFVLAMACVAVAIPPILTRLFDREDKP